MAKFGEFQIQKGRDILKAANTRPERPNVDELARLDKNLLDSQNYYPNKEREIDNEMFGELSNKWQGNAGGGSGDALISGLKAGLKKGSFMEDKERYKKVIDFTEKMRNMVADQNVKLFEEEKEYNAIKRITPRVMAYMESYKNMSPNDRKVYLQNTLEELNETAGTNYKLIDAAGSEPWKIMVSEDGFPAQLDLMDVIKTPEQKRAEYYYNSNEVKEYEKGLQSEDELNKQFLQSRIAQNNNKALQEAEKSPENIKEKKRQLIESGEIPKGAILFDEIDKAERQVHMKHMMEERDKAKFALEGLEALDEIERILEKHPNISTSVAKWANSKKDTAFGTLLGDFVDKEERDALLELEKHSATLQVGDIQQFKGQRPTDVLKKLIASMTPGSNFTKEAFDPVKEKVAKRFIKQLEVSEENNQGLIKRYVPPRQKIEYKPVSKNNQNTADPTNTTDYSIEPIVEIPAGTQMTMDESKLLEVLKSIPGLTRADIDEAARRLANGK